MQHWSVCTSIPSSLASVRRLGERSRSSGWTSSHGPAPARESARKPLALVVVLSLAGFSPLGAQSDEIGGRSDSVDLLANARRAQRDFERTRRADLPAEPGAGSHGCDERIGRVCYWYEPFADPSLLEPEIVRRARGELLDSLVAAHQQLPRDAWISGQLIRYLAEQGLDDSAVATARGCQATAWWCAALEGYARHVSGDYAGADPAFDAALRQMPDSMRCAWSDPGPLLGESVQENEGGPCPDSTWQWIWWLAQPLYSKRGNDLRTEHLARHTIIQLLEGAATPDGVPWGRDRFQLVLRFGWPTRWSRAWEAPGGLSPPPILGHEPGPSFWFFPEPALTEPWSDVTATRWDPEREQPHARYAPPYATGFATIDRVQFARFLRRDTTLTVAAFDLSGDSVFRTHPADVRLAVGRDPGTPLVVAGVSGGAAGVLSVRSMWRPVVLSLEAVGVDTPWVGRRRVMTAPDPGGAPGMLSDLLLLTPEMPLPDSLESALPSALKGSVVGIRGRRVGLYWEMYDVPDSRATVEIAVTSVKGKQNDLYPVSRPSCPLPVKPQVRLSWVEEPDGHPRGLGRSVALDLHRISRGRYIVTVQLRVGDRPLGCSSREFRIAGS